jgi:mannose-6-phosphate isomerase-like protein (cupin superfamily)
VVEEARLEPKESGLVPTGDGWFVVNVRDAAWASHEHFGSACLFEGPDSRFPQVGINIRVLRPGQANGRYHSESLQEDFLVLAGECTLLVEEQERPLRAWDFVHFPPGTCHIVVGAGDEPCVILMTGARGEGKTLRYPASELGDRYGVSVAEETPDPAVAYAGMSPPELRRPDVGPLPWDETA